MEMVEADPPLPLFGDVLESVLSHVPTLDLLPARRVSRTWRASVVSSLRRSPRQKPWLLLRLPRASVAYDPHSRSWVPLKHVLDSTQKFPNQQVEKEAAAVSPYRVVSHLYSQPVRSSHPQLHFILSSPSHLSIHRPLVSAAWTDLPSPRVWRVDPVVAAVGTTVVVAGGTWDFEDATCAAVESLDLLGAGDRRWVPRDPVPSGLGGSAAFLSVAASGGALHVLSKSSGLFSSFDAETGRWSPARDLRPDPEIELSAVGFSGERLVFVGLGEGGTSLRLWEVDAGSEPARCGEEVGSMPEEMVARLVGEGFGRMTTIGLSTAGDYAYVYNPANFEEGFFYGFVERRWESIGRPKELDDDRTARIVFGCAAPTLDQLSKLLL
ncbi:F-box/kelch-repeat protein [Iris pallida]|uniref:F-box/kelch-repeat protein n=1 Tax=Iris pallida TaxID=29817 RepID=A0AAX6E9J2_IRIPA|nr:F-box/kelch-repeat protein [Iris pallida]